MIPLARRKSATLTEVELEFMQLVWEAEEVTSDRIQETLSIRGRDLTGGTVRKVLQILMEKGYLTRRQEGRAFYYRARVPKEKAQGRLLKEMIHRVFHGSSPLLIAALLNEGALKPGELDRVSELIQEYEENQRKEERGKRSQTD